MSSCIVDVQRGKSTDCARHKGYDPGKKISGIKRHIVADMLGLPLAIALTTAQVTDHSGALMAFTQH